MGVPIGIPFGKVTFSDGKVYEDDLSKIITIIIITII